MVMALRKTPSIKLWTLAKKTITMTIAWDILRS